MIVPSQAVMWSRHGRSTLVPTSLQHSRVNFTLGLLTNFMEAHASHLYLGLPISLFILLYALLIVPIHATCPDISSPSPRLVLLFGGI